MKIVAFNGSHRAGKGTSKVVQMALDAAKADGAETELVELSECEIEFCTGCNGCMRKDICSIDDGMTELLDKLRDADGIIMASPDYFSNVSARMKNFIDRTRCLHMVANALAGKVGGIIVTCGLDNCGAEPTVGVLQRFFATHEIQLVNPRPKGPVLGSGAISSQFAGLDEQGRPQWRRVQDDPVGAAFATQLGHDMVALIKRLEA